MYRPALEIMPAVAFPPLIPLTSQVTARFRLFLTLAVNCCCPPAPTVAKAGEIVTTGVGLLGVNGNALDVAPPGAGVATLPIPAPAAAISAAVIAAAKPALDHDARAPPLPFP